MHRHGSVTNTSTSKCLPVPFNTQATLCNGKLMSLSRWRRLRDRCGAVDWLQPAGATPQPSFKLQAPNGTASILHFLLHKRLQSAPPHPPQPPQQPEPLLSRSPPPSLRPSGSSQPRYLSRPPLPPQPSSTCNRSRAYLSVRRRSMTLKTAGDRRRSELWKRRDGFGIVSPSRSLLSHAFTLQNPSFARSTHPA